MPTYLIVKNNKVINTIIWDGESDFELPENSEIVESPAEEVGINWIRDNDGLFSPPLLIKFAIYKKFSDGEVLGTIYTTEENFKLPEAQQLEYGASPCDEEVGFGWRRLPDGSFIPID